MLSDDKGYLRNSDKWRLRVYFDGSLYLPLKENTFAFDSEEKAIAYYHLLVEKIKKRLDKFGYEYDMFSFSYALIPAGRVEY